MATYTIVLHWTEKMTSICMLLSVEKDVLLCTVGQVIDTLPERGPVFGLTLLAGELYVLRFWRERDQVEVYDATSYRFQRCLTVPNACRLQDMTACEHFGYVYIADFIAECIHRLRAQGAATPWSVNDKPQALSVNAAHNLLVTCCFARKIKEFNSDGKLLRELTLPGEVSHPWHAIQLTNGQFIVCHGSEVDSIQRVSKISEDGRRVVQSHGGQRGSNDGHYYVPVHLAVDDNGFVLVADLYNRRVKLLSPTLKYTRKVVSGSDLGEYPFKMCLDARRRRLYVADNNYSHQQQIATAGRVVVLSV